MPIYQRQHSSVRVALNFQASCRRRGILIQVYATGRTPTEKLWYTTSHYADGSTRSKAMPGHEFSGIVAGLAILADEKCR